VHQQGNERGGTVVGVLLAGDAVCHLLCDFLNRHLLNRPFQKFFLEMIGGHASGDPTPKPELSINT
jgi:hypothetical protein